MGAVPEAQMTTEVEPRRRRYGSPFLALLLLVALAVVLGGIFPFRQILAQNRQVEHTRAKLDALEEENDALRRRIDDLGTNAEVERLAREELGMVRPGETGFTVSSPDGDKAVDVPAPEQEPAEDERTITRKIWDFFTGRDLVPDN
jgi:cell division protein DivIC